MGIKAAIMRGTQLSALTFILIVTLLGATSSLSIKAKEGLQQSLILLTPDAQKSYHGDRNLGNEETKVLQSRIATSKRVYIPRELLDLLTAYGKNQFHKNSHSASKFLLKGRIGFL